MCRIFECLLGILKNRDNLDLSTRLIFNALVMLKLKTSFQFGFDMVRKHTQIRHIFAALCGTFLYILYTSASDIYPFLPPLIGVLFLMFHKYYDDVNFFIPVIILLCLFYYELDKSLVVGIIPTVFFIVRLFVAQRLESVLLMNALFIVIYVGALYLFYFAGMLLCTILFKTPILEFSAIYFYYFILDAILALAYYIFIKD